MWVILRGTPVSSFGFVICLVCGVLVVWLELNLMVHA